MGHMMKRIVNMRIFSKSPVNVCLRWNKRIWSRLPEPMMANPVLISYGSLLHKLVQMQDGRRQWFGTFFFRNRPELELIRRLADRKSVGATLRISVLGCSNGAEVYSILWTVRSARPDLDISTHAMDISGEILDIARKGVYSIGDPGLVDEFIFKLITEDEMQKMFSREGD